MLIILGGLPGVGKSTIGKMVAQKIKAVQLKIDSIEQAIKEAKKCNPNGIDEIIAEGYTTAYSVAKDKLEIGHTVIADSVNSLELTHHDYRQVALSLDKPYVEIEIICSNKLEHKKRV